MTVMRLVARLDERLEDFEHDKPIFRQITATFQPKKWLASCLGGGGIGQIKNSNITDTFVYDSYIKNCFKPLARHINKRKRKFMVRKIPRFNGKTPKLMLKRT